MKALALVLFIFSMNSFASENIRCLSQYRAINGAVRGMSQASAALAADSLENANYIRRIGESLIVQSDRRVGSIGYTYRSEGDKAINLVRRLDSQVRIQEQAVLDAMLAYEDCLYSEQ